MNTKTRIREIIRTTDLEQLSLLFETQPHEVFQELNRLDFQQQYDFIQKIFDDLWPESYIIAAMLIASQDQLEESDLRLRVNELAKERAEQKVAALNRLSERLRTESTRLDQQAQSIVAQLQEAIDIDARVQSGRGRLAELRRQRIALEPALFDLRDIEGQLERIQGELGVLQGFDLEGRRRELAELQKTRDSLREEQERLNGEISQAKPQLENANRQVQAKRSELKGLQTQLEARQTEKGAIQAEIDKHQLQMEALGKAVETLRRERDQLKQKSDGTQAQLEKERAKIAQEVQALQMDLNRVQNQLENLQSMSKRLDNLPPNASRSLVQEARELRELLADKGSNSLKERLMRVLRELQSESKDVVTDILKGGR